MTPMTISSNPLNAWNCSEMAYFHSDNSEVWPYFQVTRCEDYPITWQVPNDQLDQDILATCQEASVAGWDGYNALPVSKETCSNAIQFAATLPFGLAIPEVCAEADGSVCFEWYKDAANQISFSVNEDNKVSYAARCKGKPLYGFFFQTEPLPENIMILLHQVSP